jgi:uncharacterized membrane protein
MFDRILELGADTLIISRKMVGNISSLEDAAGAVGYKKYYENEGALIYKYPSPYKFGTSVRYEGIAIGSYGANASYIFPNLETGEDNYIDDYSYEELKKMSLVYLSGFQYKDKNTAEALLLRLSRAGVRVVIDAQGLEESFLGVSPMPVALSKGYKDMFYKGKKLQMRAFPKDMELWKTYFLGGIDNKDSYTIAEDRLINYIGNKYNNKLTFIGLNLPYYALLTKDAGALQILEDTFNMKAYCLPRRVLHRVDIAREGNVLSIRSDASDVIVPVGALDAFYKLSGDYRVKNSLIYLKTPELKIRIIYPYLVSGAIISVVFLLVISVLSFFLRRHNKALERRNRFRYRFR